MENNIIHFLLVNSNRLQNVPAPLVAVSLGLLALLVYGVWWDLDRSGMQIVASFVLGASLVDWLALWLLPRAGRSFGPADMAPDARAVIVDQGFVDEVLRGQNPVGRRVRFALPPWADEAAAQAPRPWYEIVGVVPELGMRHPAQAGRAAGVYMPAAPGSDGVVHMVVHARGEPTALAADIRTVAAGVDPTLQLAQFQGLDRVMDDILWFLRLWLRATLVLSAIALLLSLAGIYAVLSFTVARRTREIGVRVALGAPKTRVVLDVFRKPLVQVALGLMAGALLTTSLLLLPDFAEAVGRDPSGLMPSVRELAVLMAYMAGMAAICLLGCLTPMRRALAQELLIQINEAVGAPAPRDIRPGLVWGPVHGVLFNSFIVQ